MSSGHRISKPSDDPVGIENALRIKSSITMVNQWQNNVTEALSYMNTTDSVLGDLTSLLQRTRELAIQGSNGTNSTNERNTIAEEVKQIINQVKTLANTKVGNKYIFAGTNTDTEPMPASGAWVGNQKPIAFDVGNNIQLDVMVNGADLFINSGSAYSLLSNSSPPSALPATTGILDELYNQLLSGNSATINATLDGLDQNINSVTALRADLGARINRVESIQSQLSSMTYNLTSNLSGIEDADMAKTITDFTNQQNVYQSALSVGAKIIQPSLIDFMR